MATGNNKASNIPKLTTFVSLRPPLRTGRSISSSNGEAASWAWMAVSDSTPCIPVNQRKVNRVSTWRRRIGENSY
jgi:hypothetical protein